MDPVEVWWPKGPKWNENRMTPLLVICTTGHLYIGMFLSAHPIMPCFKMYTQLGAWAQGHLFRIPGGGGGRFCQEWDLTCRPSDHRHWGWTHWVTDSPSASLCVSGAGAWLRPLVHHLATTQAAYGWARHSARGMIRSFAACWVETHGHLLILCNWDLVWNLECIKPTCYL